MCDRNCVWCPKASFHLQMRSYCGGWRFELCASLISFFESPSFFTTYNKIGKKKTSDPSDDSGSTKTILTISTSFTIQARKNGILDPISSRPPKNLEEIRERLAAPRETASPPESVYEDYAYIVEWAINEATMVGDTLPLLKIYPREPYQRALNRIFKSFRRTWASIMASLLRSPT